MKTQELFEKIQANHNEKQIASLCRKLIKKCSFNSGADVENLCRLAYWLFVYGYEDEALFVCEITHNVEFPGKGIWNVWDFIMFMWGLEVHILKQQSNMEEANKIIQQMDSLWLYPPKLPAVVPEYEKARRDRFTLLSCSREKEISNASSRVRANDWRFIALFKLIGYGSTGLFPNLEKDKTAVEMIIKDYIQTLRQGK